MRNISQQVFKDKIRNIAASNNQRFNEVLKKCFLERFLVRLSKSQFKGQFLLKGGHLLNYYIFIGRETKDLDFELTYINLEIKKLESVFKKICSIDVGDGFSFDLHKVDILAHNHMICNGFRVNLVIWHSVWPIKDHLQMDLGVGDKINPKIITMPLLAYKDEPIFEEKIKLNCYPVENIFAEKLQTLVIRGGINSRMKDFHDLYLLTKKGELLDKKTLLTAIEETFRRRKTQKDFPIQYSEVALKNLERQWSRHINGLGPMATNLKLPKTFQDTILTINKMLEHY